MTTQKHRTDIADISSAPLSDILERADHHMKAEKYAEAVTAFEAAAKKLSDYDQRLRSAVDDSIQKMALPGCAATAPLPQTRHMIALRSRL